MAETTTRRTKARQSNCRAFVRLPTTAHTTVSVGFDVNEAKIDAYRRGIDQPVRWGTGRG